MVERNPPPRLAWRIALLVLLASTLATLAGVAYQLRRDLRADVALVEGRLEQVGLSHGPALQASLWAADEEQVEAQLRGMLDVPDMTRVVLELPDGRSMSAGQGQPRRSRSATWTLSHEHRGQTVPLGVLTVTASLDRVFERAGERTAVVLATETIQTVVLVAALLLILHSLLLRHIGTVVAAAGTWGEGRLGHPLKLQRRRTGRVDELDRLESALDGMRGALQSSLDRVSGQRDELEREVRQRTRQIRRVNRDLEAEVEVRREAEASLREREAWLRLLLEHFPGVVWTLDKELAVRSVAGGRARLVFGDDPEGRGLREALQDDIDLTPLLEAHAEALDEGLGLGEFFVGGHTFEVRVEADSSLESAALVGIALDVTERRRMQAQQVEARVLRSQKLESLGVLAGGVAHDFNNLLVGIMGNASLALAQLDPSHPAHKSIAASELAARRAAELTHQLLAYSGHGRFVMEAVDLGALVEEMSRLLQAAIPGNTLLKLQRAPDLPSVEADPAQLRQVVMNLITNAAEALGPDGGVVRAVVDVVDADADYIAQGWVDEALPPGRYVQLEVSDTGCGMDEATRLRIFDPFFTTKETGHGLGLAATLGIVRGHHGTVRVYSEPGRGTTIKILLPASSQPAAEPPPPAERSPPPLSGRVVLVVDDDPDVRGFAVRALQHGGMEVLSAPDGATALRLFEQEKARIELVLLDMKMPGMSGRDCFVGLRAIRPDIPVLLCSGYNEQEATNAFTGRGLTGFIQKPYRLSELLTRIGEVLAGIPSRR